MISKKIPAALFIVAGVIAGVAALRPDPSTDVAAVPLPDPRVMLAGGYGYDPLDEVVGQWRDRVIENPTDNLSRVQLGTSLIGLARENGDLDLYPRAESQLRRAVAAAPTDPVAVTALAGALSAQHEFVEARRLIAPLAAERPADLSLQAALVDVQIDLGDYDAALALLEAMVETAPDSVATLSRQARVAALTGDNEAAVGFAREMLLLGADVGLRPADAAGLWFQLGFFQYQAGAVDEAETSVRAALTIDPDHGASREFLGKVLVAQGRYEEAADTYEAILAEGPVADLHGLLAEVYTALGRDDEAAEQVRLGLALAEDQIGVYPAERRHLAGFFADHDPATFLRLMEEDVATREDIGGLDLLAWAQYLNGEVDEAQATMDRALALGTEEATLLFHAGMIEAEVGEPDRARDLLESALDLNPGFDLSDVALARATLADL